MRNSIKYQLTLFVATAITIVVIISSWFYYQEFKTALNERVLLQLTSIKRLKRLQIENYLNEKFEDLSLTYQVKQGEKLYADSLPFRNTTIALPDSMKEEGIYDFTHAHEHDVQLAFVKHEGKHSIILITDISKIQKILLERTGMGQSGETYLVGADYHMRSQSRFLDWQEAKTVEVKSKGVERGFITNPGTGIYEDYRGETVFGAFHHITNHGLNWVILSEIDEKEALQPLESVFYKMIFIGIACVTLAVIITYLVSIKLTQPIVRVQTTLEKISRGEVADKTTLVYLKNEIGSMDRALDELIDSTKKLTYFADEIGKMNLDTTFEARSENDQLGKALKSMQTRLTQFRSQELELQKINKRALIQGQENERKRLSRDLHDDIGPLLTSLKLYLSSQDLPNQKEVNEQIDYIIQEVRRLSKDLMPSALFDFGIRTALQNYIKTLQQNTKILIHFAFDNSEDITLTEEINIALYRIVLESINNAIKHSNAGEINVSITVFDDLVTLFLKDNGTNQKEIVAGNGIINMKERTAALNGTFEILLTSSGVSIEVEIPIDHD